MFLVNQNVPATLWRFFQSLEWSHAMLQPFEGLHVTNDYVQSLKLRRIVKQSFEGLNECMQSFIPTKDRTRVILANDHAQCFKSSNIYKGLNDCVILLLIKNFPPSFEGSFNPSNDHMSSFNPTKDCERSTSKGWRIKFTILQTLEGQCDPLKGWRIAGDA